MAQNKNTDWWQEEKIKENIIKRNHLPEKICSRSNQVDDEGEKALCISQTGLEWTALVK